jgi:hypothetical protein
MPSTPKAQPYAIARGIALVIPGGSTQLKLGPDGGSAPCDALSPYGYLGIEESVIGKIIDWVATFALSPGT